MKDFIKNNIDILVKCNSFYNLIKEAYCVKFYIDTKIKIDVYHVDINKNYEYNKNFILNKMKILKINYEIYNKRMGISGKFRTKKIILKKRNIIIKNKLTNVVDYISFLNLKENYRIKNKNKIIKINKKSYQKIKALIINHNKEVDEFNKIMDFMRYLKVK